ncbi:MAG: type I 3-dehydroquinate dehydratase [Verrucomicrobiota bacterium]
MTGRPPSELFPDPLKPKVVATVHHPDDIALLSSNFSPELADIAEFRLDCLGEPKLPLEQSPVPIIITARHPDEGGTGSCSETERLQLLMDHYKSAAAVDLELASKDAIRELAPALREENKTLILSWHDFKQTPPSSLLNDKIKEAESLHADVVKIAATPESLGDLERLLDLLKANSRIPISVMGMGPFGPVSRLLLAQNGSCLNYGYLSQPNAPGQWPAHLLKTALQALGPAS